MAPAPKQKGNNQLTPDIAWARDFLKPRLLEQASAEGTPLSELELRYLDNCYTEGDAWHALDKEFGKQENPVDFQIRMSEILRRRYANEVATNPGIALDYLRAVNTLEDYWPEFELWSIAVPALAKNGSSSRLTGILIAIIFSVFVLIYWIASHK